MDENLGIDPDLENNSNIDTSQPNVVIQETEDGVDTQNNVVKAVLRKKYEETGDEHYKRQLDLKNLVITKN